LRKDEKVEKSRENVRKVEKAVVMGIGRELG